MTHSAIEKLTALACAFCLAATLAACDRMNKDSKPSLNSSQGVINYKPAVNAAIAAVESMDLDGLRKTAELGNKASMYRLALAYSKGQGLEKDVVQSYKWFSLAAAGNDADAIKKRNELELQMMPEQIQRAKALAKEWKSQSS